MPRRPQQAFHCQPLAELTRQLLFAPPGKRLEQVRRAERLHDELETDTAYPIEYLVYRITGYRRDPGSEATLLVGEAVRPDLRLIIDQLSRSVVIRPDDEAAETIEGVAARLNVSTKTVHRWRKAGLRWRWITPPDGGQKHIAITESALQVFRAQHGQRLERASNFSTLSEEDRQRVIVRARELVRESDEPLTLNRVAARLAREFDRATETLRLTLEKHDRAEPGHAIFARHDRPLTPRQKRLIERAHRRGIAVRRIAERLGRSRHTIHRIIRARRAAAARQIELSCIHWPTFDRDDADAVLRREPLEGPESAHAGASDGQARVPLDDLPEPLRALYHQPPISARRQRTLFIRYNYLKYRASQMRAAFDHADPRARELDEFDALLAEARLVRAMLVRANLPVVLSVARRHLISESFGQGGRLFELLESGQALLLEAIEHYNADRSHTFAAYLTNRLLTRFAQLEHEADGDATRRQARRRRSADEVHHRLIAHARAHRIDLIGEAEPSPAADG